MNVLLSASYFITLAIGAIQRPPHVLLNGVRFGGFVPLYHRPASHEGKDMGGLVCAAHRRKIREFPTLKRTLDFGIEKGRLSSKQPPDRGSNTSYLLSGKPGNH